MKLNAEQHAKFMRTVSIKHSGCWEWTSHIKNGYGYFHFRNPARWKYAHRISYEHWVGAIPDGLQIDHLCRNGRCVNPSHLEAVTNRENGRRGIKGVLTTHCPQGHPYDEANTKIDKNGWRKCKQCSRFYARRAMARARDRARSSE